MTAPYPRTIPLLARLLAALAAGAWVLIRASGAWAAPPEGEMAVDLARVASYLADYRNIPGVTPEEVAAIEALKSSGKSLRFGTFRSGEAVISRHGVRGGFLISLADTISEMFGLKIEHQFVGRRELKTKLESLELDLACEIPFSEVNGETLIMTSPVFERLVKVYRRRGDAVSEYLLESGQQGSGRSAIPKYGFLEGAGVAELVLAEVRRPVETVIFENYREAVERLLSGSLDAFFDEAPAALYFEVFVSIESSSYYPPVNTPLSLATGQKELAAIISVFQKFLEAEGHDWLFEIYARSVDDVRRLYFEDSLDLEQERVLARLKAQDAAIKVVAGSNDYPATFWNKRDQAFEGIAHDVLAELSKVTGLRFEVLNSPNTTDNQLKEMIYFGLADLMVNFNFFDEDADEVLLSAIPHNFDRYALLTTSSHAEIKFSQIAYEIVGLVPGDKYSDVYIRWFPNARNYKRYGSMSLALEALRQGQVDCLMATSNYLLNLTNYLEEPLFKTALVFDEEVPHGFAYGPSKAALRGLIDKALGFVDLGPIQSRWYAKFFNYRHKFIKDSAPFLVGFCALLIISLTALIRVNARNRRLNQKLESMVAARTDQLMSTQKKLEREKLLMSSIVDTCPVSLVITRKGKILFLNPIAKRFLGKEAGEDWTGSFVDCGVLEEYRAILAVGNQVDWLPTKLKRADGRVRETLVNTFENDYYGEKAFISWITD
ncbi:MAG: transporter substrate-binding domain-containing protein, partial [Deltaproteobacteria bacterium]|nr:transporter substrate-binding domain-containing protein [Deltaproteobacteria bacterium]